MPEPELQRVTRGGRGVSAPVAGLIATGVLAAVVWAGISGRASHRPDATPPGIPVAQRSPVAASAETAQPAAPRTGDTPRPERSAPAPSPRPVLANVSVARDAYGVIAKIDGRMYLDVLDEVEHGRLRGSFRIPFPDDVASADEISIAQLWTRDRASSAFVEVGSWPLELAPLVPGTERGGLVLRDQEEGRSLKGAPRAVRRGFAVEVRAVGHRTFAIIDVGVDLGKRRRLGENGIFDNRIHGAGPDDQASSSADPAWRAWWQASGWYPYADHARSLTR